MNELHQIPVALIDLPALLSSICTAVVFVGLLLIVAYLFQERRR